MKTRNIDLKNNQILTNHIYKHILLEAPTPEELDKKVKEYEQLLVKAITNAYRISGLTLDRNHRYHVSPEGNYQTSIIMNFDGKKKMRLLILKKH